MVGETPAVTEQPSVLIVEDDRSLRESLAMILSHQEYVVAEAESGELGLQWATQHNPTVVVLDINLPGMDGVQVCSRLRSRGFCGAILMLTARHQVEDRLAGFHSGADDYLPKPFALKELLARIEVMVRRVQGQGPPVTSESVWRVGDVVLHTDSRVVQRAGQEVSLTKTEYDLLAFLVANAGVAMAKEDIMLNVWGPDAQWSANSLNVFVSKLRTKLDGDGGQSVIRTVRGVGYMVRERR